MNIAMDVVQLSRLQFGLTAMYHFLFVPLTLGLSVLLGIMESVYVMTGRDIWRQMTKFWGVLFGINFAMGVATGITMEFQFGMNWAYYSHYVGDVFGAPLAIEGLMAFFLEATFIGLFFFGWDRLSKVRHLAVTWLVALGLEPLALWILIANGWMQHPVGARFNPDTMRMEVTDFMAVIFNPVAQAKFVHTVSAGYVTGAVFVLAISAFYLLRGVTCEIAKRSMTVAASFGLASALSVVVLGDESGYTAGENQKMKIAAIEAMWDTEPAPASFTLFGLPNQQTHQTDYEVKVPWMLGPHRDPIDQHLGADRACRDQTQHPGHLDLVVGHVGLLVRQSEQCERCRRWLGVPHGFNRRDLHFLVFAGRVAALVAKHDHRQRRRQTEARGDRKGPLCEVQVTPSQQVERTDREHEHRTGHIARAHRMDELGLGDRVEDHGHEVRDLHAHRVGIEMGANRMLHPAIGDEDPKCRQVRPERHEPGDR